MKCPMFFFIDPFGYKGFSMKTISRILKYPIVECFVNFMIYDINRFLEDEGKHEAFTELFGTPDFMKKCYSSDNADWYSCVLNFYCSSLKEIAGAKYVMPFRINTPDQARRPRYYLIHASKSYTAFKLMKDIMHRKSDSPFAFEAIGIKSDQMSLFEEPDKVDLRNRILSFLEKYKQQMPDYSDVEEWAYENTNGVSKTIKDSLILLESKGKIRIKRCEGQRTNTVVKGAKIAIAKIRK